VPFAGGSDQFFSDVNRAPPPEAGLDAVCFGLCPQVHAADDLSLMENLPALADCVATARILRPGLPVAVSPVTLVARHGPYPAGAPDPNGLPGSVDVRQFGLYGASWTLGAVAWLAGVGTESVTLYETTGWQGIAERDTGSPRPELVRVRPGDAFPVLHVLADLAEWRDMSILATEVSQPLAIGALAVGGAETRGVLVANHTADPQAIVVRGLGAERVRLRRLDETTAEEAMISPELFRTMGEPLSSPGGAVELELAPYAVVRIET
jgi:hypothetical protein